MPVIIIHHQCPTGSPSGTSKCFRIAGAQTNLLKLSGKLDYECIFLLSYSSDGAVIQKRKMNVSILNIGIDVVSLLS